MKLRRRSPDELRVRGMQKLATLRERARPYDPHLESAGRLLEDFRARITPVLSPAFVDRERTAEALPHVCAPALTTHADAIVEGRFDLLGFRDLSFGSPIDWHLDPVSGFVFPRAHWTRVARSRAAGADRKIVWELNRHGSLVVLGRAYWLTGDDRYAAAFVEQLSGWIEQNPAGTGVNWSSSLEVALRLIAWTWALTLFRDSERLTSELFARALRLIAVHARHVSRYLSTYSSPNTHLTGEALGLFYAGTLWPELPDAGAWRELGETVLLSQLRRQVTADGVYFERATAYQLYTIDFYVHLVVLAEANDRPLPPFVRERLAALFEHLRYVAQPDGTIPLLGDDDGGRLLPLDERDYGDVSATLALGASLLERPDLRPASDGAREELLWLRGEEAVGVEASEQPRTTSRAFTAGGIHVLRDGWTDRASAAVVDCGEHGGAHDHADALSVALTVSGRPLLVDPGTYSYLRDGGADDLRSTAAHNTVVVDGQSSSVPKGPFGWSHQARGSLLTWWSDTRFDFFRGRHDGYLRLQDPVTHVRSVLFVKPRLWVIRDRLEAAGDHTYEVRFHFAPGTAVRLTEGAPAVVDAGIARLVMVGPGSWQLSEAYVSPCYGRRERAPVATRTAHGTGPQEFVTFVLPAGAA